MILMSPVHRLETRNQLSREHHIWLEVGHYANNTLRYIDVNKIHDYLGDRMCNALPAFHIITGSDYTSAFNKKGKIKPLKLLQDNVDFQSAFSELGSEEELLTVLFKM